MSVATMLLTLVGIALASTGTGVLVYTLLLWVDSSRDLAVTAADARGRTYRPLRNLAPPAPLAPPPATVPPTVVQRYAPAPAVLVEDPELARTSVYVHNRTRLERPARERLAALQEHQQRVTLLGRPGYIRALTRALEE